MRCVQSEPDIKETGMDETFEKRTYSSVDELISDLEAAISSIEMVKMLAEGVNLRGDVPVPRGIPMQS